ncbi:Na-translocating system protein MpsC family protein [Effusibacillus pohliae]|uniref:Na-translocating system protein MpsC family protein n=1 Tax=Effusibacillus pohliae TaxID=232270 RepID=UPI00035D95DF|nr:Na-translocating system protein MpsC family protein [Effusibacillus pohliae]
MKVRVPFNVLKQEIIKAYNSINQEMYAIGVSSQRIEFLGDKILICAVHKRIPALKVLDDSQRTLTRMVDSSLIELNKWQLANRIEEIVGVPIKTVLKDYDPRSEMAATVVIFEDSLEE